MKTGTKTLSILSSLILAAYASVSPAGGPPCPPDPNLSLQYLAPPGEVAGTANFSATTQSFVVSEPEDFHTAIANAPSGSRIVVTQSMYGIHALINDKDLTIEGTLPFKEILGGEISFFDEPFPTIEVTGASSVVFRNLRIYGPDGGTGEGNRTRGSDGGPAVKGSTVAFVNCGLHGGNGGNSGDGTIGVPSPDGGNGGSALEATGPAYADSRTDFTGGSGGYGGPPHLPDTCCFGCPGNVGAAVSGGAVQWRNVVVQMQIPQASRAAGDFDQSGFVDILDFLFLLDYWQLPDVTPKIDIPDFLAVLDNWMTNLPE